MPPTYGDEALDTLLANAGLTLSEAQKQELKGLRDDLDAMKARVRQARGPMAEPAHIFRFTPEDLA
jgi:hypothetical protein